MVFSSSRTRLLLILVLCAFSCFAVGDVTRDEVIAFKKLRGSSNSQAQHEVLEVDEQEVGPSRRNVEGASDLDLNKHPDHSEVKVAKENAWAVGIKAGMTGTVENTAKASPANKGTFTPPPPSPPIESKNSPAKPLPPANKGTSTLPPPSPPIESKNSPAKPVPPANKGTSTLPPPSPPIESKNSPAKPVPPAKTTTVSPPPPAGTGDAGKALSAHGGACDHEPLIGILAPTGGEDGHHDYTLTVENFGKSKLDVAIHTSNGWKATPGELALSKGQNKSVTVSMTDNEAARHIAKLNISWSDGDCYVDVPAQNVPGNVDHSSYSTFLNAPGTAALLLGGSLVFLVVLGVAGIWGCISWRAHARRHGDAETKYQELEMAAADTKQGDEEGSPSAGGWDEVWEDDDWEDTEAGRTSSTALTLSSAGLNSRRANKDGWDSSWDD